MSWLGFVFSSAPHTSASGREGLDALLATSAYSESLRAVFVGEGVLQLLKHQRPESLQIKDHVSGFKLLDLYDVEEVFVSASALRKFGLSSENLIIDHQVMSDVQMAALLAECDKLVNF